MVLLFEVVGAVSLRWDGAAHETWRGRATASSHGSLTRPWAVTGQSLQPLPPSSHPVPEIMVGLVVATEDPAGKWPVF